MHKEVKHSYDMGIVGNCSFLAYIGKSSNIEWLCWPFFDSSPIFYNLISQDRGGSFQILPITNYTSKQYYIENTNILVTEFITQDGSFQVTDFAPRFEQHSRIYRPSSIFRKIHLLSGNPRIKVICSPFDFSSHQPIAPTIGSSHLTFKTQGHSIRLTTDVSKHHLINNQDFALTTDHYLILSFSDNHIEAPLKETYEDFFHKTKQYWNSWIRRTTLPIYYQNEVIRSALALKLHQDEDSGAIIASGTTSLPEYPGEERNWDYRYCWIRDSYFTLSALYSLGHFSEIEKYSNYIQSLALSNDKKIRPVYRINSQPPLPEIEVPQVSGYHNSKPVRIGNAAYDQTQHDSYGQILLSLLPLFIDKRVRNNSSPPSLEIVHKMLDQITRTLTEKDSGMWEYRNISQLHGTSTLFHWSGALAAQRIGEHLNDPKLIQKAKNVVDLATVQLESCYDESLRCYTMAPASKNLDAGLFLLASMNFLTNSKKATDHIEQLEKLLGAGHSLFHRYKAIDDFGETRSAFLVCSFWFIDSLIAVGKIDEANRHFKKVISFSNDLLLFSEDIDPTTFSQWGNFPQTYSHVGLINSAFKISNASKKLLFEAL